MSSREFLKNVLAVAIGVAVSLLIAEAGLRAFVPEAKLLNPREEPYWLHLYRNKPQASSPQMDTVADPWLGWRMRPLHAGVGAQHNSAGFRGAAEHSQVPQSLRIVTIGDSFTYGLGVRDDETFSALIEQLTGAEVINAGVNAYGVDQAILLWEQQASRLMPCVVVLGYFVDDFYRSALGVRDAPKPNFAFDEATGRFNLLDPAQALWQAQQRFPSIGHEWHITLALQWLWDRAMARVAPLDEARLMAKARLSKFLLTRFKQSARRLGSIPLLVFIGHRQPGHVEHSWIEDSVLQSCRDLDMTCINLAAAMRGASVGDFYGHNGHFSVRGHRFAAEQISQALGRLVDLPTDREPKSPPTTCKTVSIGTAQR